MLGSRYIPDVLSLTAADEAASAGDHCFLYSLAFVCGKHCMHVISGQISPANVCSEFRALSQSLSEIVVLSLFEDLKNDAGH
ncbi:unnamed protein product [Allacma fusca]|uniref:Uncharacterized protein n=1 Tax=Allacma fusca TaxID=39272 RepID=A0A8J2PFT5_9HEXA|nr:unnamed protein product [Allacma fusca]